MIFGGGQGSSGVLGGQSLKTVFTRYLEVGSLDKFHIYSTYMPYGQRWKHIVFGGGQRSSGFTGFKLKNLLA
ncbi:hypothetical protein HOLleu_29122 [Holothuria leucospilota]|uniref:Uncharacterized protein n=1 Tax=Holothuria leucospilota TaxID=206669 RepID=A0A9Q1H2F2_HOLLE|nr:hypothetical protein HOLleu_29122 [Holothuria leucospilota]